MAAKERRTWRQYPVCTTYARKPQPQAHAMLCFAANLGEEATAKIKDSAGEDVLMARPHARTAVHRLRS